MKSNIISNIGFIVTVSIFLFFTGWAIINYFLIKKVILSDCLKKIISNDCLTLEGISKEEYLSILDRKSSMTNDIIGVELVIRDRGEYYSPKNESINIDQSYLVS